MYTLKDVAKKAGVSPTIASYVLNNSNYVSAEKRAAVLQAAKELNYHVNSNARGLRKKETSNIAVITFDERSEMSSEITYYLEQFAYDSGYYISVSSINIVAKSISYLETLMSQKYDGMIFLSNPFNRAQLQQLIDSNLPVVMFEMECAEVIPKISVLKPNTYESVKLVINRLIHENGHRKIGYITFGDPTNTGEKGPYGQGLRAKAYLDAMLEAGLPIPYDWVFQLSDQNSFPYYKDSVAEIVQRLQDTPKDERPTAFFTSLDSIGAMFISQLSASGIPVPREVEVVGFGDTSSALICNPTLSTIHMDYKKVAEKLFHMFIELCREKKNSFSSMELSIQYRNSTRTFEDK